MNKQKIIEKQDELITVLVRALTIIHKEVRDANCYITNESDRRLKMYADQVDAIQSELSSLKAEADTDDVQEFMNDVHKWADDTFGTERTALAPLHHLKKEVDEAIEAMESHNQWIIIEELADCFILILNSSSKYKLSFQELFDAAKEKMIKNKARKWGKPDENGVVEHIEAEKEVSDEDIENCVIMHGQKVFRGLYFTSIKSARNYIKMQHPKRKFKEISENKFADTQYGATFEIIVLIKPTETI